MTILLCDVGGTHIRFASSFATGPMTTPEKLRIDIYNSLAQAIEKYLLAQSLRPADITHLYLAFSNRNSWSTADIASVLPHAKIHQINDFAANAEGICDAKIDEFSLLHEGTGENSQSFTKVVIGVGTGVGLASIISLPNGGKVLRSHGGHMLPALSKPEHRVAFDEIGGIKKDGTITIYEDILSGRGLFNLYCLLCSHNHLNPAYHDISDLLISGRDDPVFHQALSMFHEILGIFSHQAVAFLHSYGGIYLTGGMIDRLIASGLFDISSFLTGFHQKMIPIVMCDVLATPVFWVRDEFISLRGLLRVARQDIKREI